MNGQLDGRKSWTEALKKLQKFYSNNKYLFNRESRDAFAEYENIFEFWMNCRRYRIQQQQQQFHWFLSFCFFPSDFRQKPTGRPIVERESEASRDQRDHTITNYKNKIRKKTGLVFYLEILFLYTAQSINLPALFNIF